MGLVIKTKGTQAPAGSEKLFRDPLVSNGTLLLQDFSNRGTLYDFRLQNGDPVYDLSREVSVPKGVNNNTTIVHNSAVDPALTPGKGFRVDNLGNNPGSAQDLGINLGTSLLDYLEIVGPGAAAWFWVRIDQEKFGGAFLTSTGDGGGTGFPLRLNITGSRGMSVTFAGGHVILGADDFANDGLVQVAVEYKGEGQYLEWYKNGVKQTNTYEPTASFGNPTSDLVLGKIDTLDKGGIMYRWGVEDLNASGRTLGELVQKDWEYCNGIGEYVGLPTKRPFIDTV